MSRYFESWMSANILSMKSQMQFVFVLYIYYAGTGKC